MNSTSYQLIIVVPTYNRKRKLSNLLDQIEKQNLVDDLKIKVIVVIDGSTDGTLTMVREKHPNIEIVLGDGNWWYTKSINEGFKYGMDKFDPDLFLTMNDDTEIHENYIKSLVDSYNQVDEGSIVGSVSFTKSEPIRIITSGMTYKNRILGLLKSYLPKFSVVDPREVKNKILPSVVLPGRGMLIPSKTLKNLHFFDESLKQYHSDEDFCFRAIQNGYQVYISWNAHIYVYEELTDAGSSFLRQNFKSFCLSFFRPTSRLYIPSNAKMLWRHKYKMLWPVNFLLFLSVSVYNYFFKTKLK